MRYKGDSALRKLAAASLSLLIDARVYLECLIRDFGIFSFWFWLLFELFVDDLPGYFVTR
jgi:hypothetical protein